MFSRHLSLRTFDLDLIAFTSYAVSKIAGHAEIPHAIQNGIPLPGNLLETSATIPNISSASVRNCRQHTHTTYPIGILGNTFFLSSDSVSKFIIEVFRVSDRVSDLLRVLDTLES
jgi:hypothetical protein